MAFVLLAVGPFLVVFAPWPLALEPIHAVLTDGYALQCHGQPLRSMSVSGALLPVCARCLGIYVGLGLGALTGRPRLTDRGLVLWLLGAVSFMLLDVASEWIGLRPALSALRLGTGLFLAYPVGIAVVRLHSHHETK